MCVCVREVCIEVYVCAYELTQLPSAASHHLLPRPYAAQDGLLQLGLHVFGLLEGQAVHALERLLTLHGEQNMGLFLWEG